MYRLGKARGSGLCQCLDQLQPAAASKCLKETRPKETCKLVFGT